MHFHTTGLNHNTPAQDAGGQTPTTGAEKARIGNPSLDATFHAEASLSPELGADFSPSRGHLPVFFSRSATSFDTEQPAVVLANAGGQLANARGYHEPENASFAAIVRDHEQLVGPHALLFTKPEDLFVVAAAKEEQPQVVNLLNAIKATALAAGIPLTGTYQLPETIDSWLNANQLPEAIVPLTVESHLFSRFHRDYTAGDELLSMSHRNAEAYRKDAVEKLWGDAGLPLLKSAYISPKEIESNAAAVVSNLRQYYAAYESIVVSRVDGSGGFGIARVRPEELSTSFLEEISGGETLQVQAYLPLVSSPCFIGTISPDSSRILHMSEQVFARFGTHAGNTWSRSFADEVRQIAPGIDLIATEAFERLREAGIFGQVNVDIMICSQETQAQLRLDSNVFLREANIRPAGSSIMLRLRDGTLPDGSAVDRIHTVQNIPIPRIVMDSDLLPSYLQTFPERGTAIVLTNYNYKTEQAQLALLGDCDVSSTTLKQLEERLRNA